MSSPPTYRIFLSTVTRELGSYRVEVARALRRKELEVRDQEHFRQGPATLLEQLRDYIKKCDAVILLIGERCGAFPTEEHAAALGVIPLFDSYRAATGQSRGSYTQWELFLAKHYGKKTYVFLSDPGFSADEPNPEDADLRSCQAAYRAWIETTGEHRDALTIKAKLIEDVLVLPFPDFNSPKPINLPFASLGVLFQGREPTLDRLHESLANTPARKATAIAGKAVHGLGGVGKTRLAIEYAWRYAEEYSALLFVGAGSRSDLRRNFAALSGPSVLNLPEQEATDEEICVAAVLRWLGEQAGWLLILDNVDSEEAAVAVDALIPRLRGGHVLLTGRLAQWGAEVEPIELDVLTEKASTDFLLARTEGRRRATKEDGDQVVELVRELGFLPLALEQAGAYIAKRRLTLTGYLMEWHSRHDQVLSWFDQRLSHYPASVAATWQTSFDRLSTSARRLLERLAWLGPEPIPESLLELPIPDLPEVEADQQGILSELATYSLVTRAIEAPTFTVHRLVQDVTRSSLRNASGHGPLTEALTWINAAFVGDPGNDSWWPTRGLLMPHARAVLSFADANHINDLTMISLARKVSEGSLRGTRAMAATIGLFLDEKKLGKDHPKIATYLNEQGESLLYRKQFGEAEHLFRRALKIDESSFGADHNNVARDLNNLARSLVATGRSAEAEPLMLRALAIHEERFGRDHPKVATDLNELAVLLQDTSRPTEAEQLLARKMHEAALNL